MEAWSDGLDLPPFPESRHSFDTVCNFWASNTANALVDTVYLRTDWSSPWFTAEVPSGFGRSDFDSIRVFSAVNEQQKRGYELNLFRELNPPAYGLYLCTFGEGDIGHETYQRLVINGEQTALTVALVNLVVPLFLIRRVDDSDLADVSRIFTKPRISGTGID